MGSFSVLPYFLTMLHHISLQCKNTVLDNGWIKIIRDLSCCLIIVCNSLLKLLFIKTNQTKHNIGIRIFWINFPVFLSSFIVSSIFPCLCKEIARLYCPLSYEGFISDNLWKRGFGICKITISKTYPKVKHNVRVFRIEF